MTWWLLAFVVWLLVSVASAALFGWLVYVGSDAYREEDRPWRRHSRRHL